MKERTAKRGLYFGSLLRMLRERHGHSTFTLQNASGVASGNIGHIEKGTRGVPRPKAVYDLAEAMHLSTEERLLFFERAIGDLILEDVRNYAGYLFLALAVEEDIEKVSAYLRKRGIPVTPEKVHDQLLAIAQSDKNQAVREMLAAEIFTSITVDPRNGEVRAQLGPFAGGLLRSQEIRNAEAAVRAELAREEG